MLGYDVCEVGDGRCILAAAIVEQFIVGTDGSLVPLTEGSTRSVVSTVAHMGIVKTRATASTCRDDVRYRGSSRIPKPGCHERFCRVGPGNFTPSLSQIRT
jgi:hypothetical protein